MAEVGYGAATNQTDAPLQHLQPFHSSGIQGCRISESSKWIGA